MSKNQAGPLITKDMSIEQGLKILKLTPLKRHIYQAFRMLDGLNIGPKTKITELGCSGHETLTLFHKMGVKDITIADYDKELLKDIKKDFDEDIKVYNIDFNDPLPMADASADLVTTFEVAEHIVKAEDYLKELNRILNDKGLLLITTPNHAFYKSRIRGLKGRRLGMEGIHYRFYTKDQFEEMLTDAGFEIIKRNSFGHVPFGDNQLLRKILGVKNIRHRIPESMEGLCAILFVWLCRKAG